VKTKDLIAPNKVTNFKLEENTDGVKITWTNPSNTDLNKVVLSKDGSVIYEGKNQEYLDETEFVEGKYTYSIYTQDNSGNKSGVSEIVHEYILEEEVVEQEETVTITSGNDQETDIEDNPSISEGEEIEVKIPVGNILQDGDFGDIDKVVLQIEDKEYEMTLSEDKKYFVTKAVAPKVKGEHTITAKAIKGEDIISQLTMNILVESEQGNLQDIWSEYSLYIIIGIAFIVLTVTGIVIVNKRSK
jgi:hypothetical protein